jgi:hypothetical protein
VSRDDRVRAREANALTLERQPREDEVRGRRADVDADGPQVEPLGRYVAGVIVLGVLVVVVVVRRGR